MKIAIDCRMYKSSGIGTYLREILPFLIKEKNNEYLLIGDIKVLKEYEKYSNIKIKECKIPIFSIKEVFYFPIKEINKCDCFYTPNYNIPGRITIPIYSTIHDVLFLDMPELVSKLGYLIRKIFYNRAYYLSKKIFTVSNFSKERIKYHLGDKKEIVVTYNGVSEYILKNDNINYIKKDYILFVGNIKKHKGLRELLIAYQEAKKEGLTSELIIVGEKNNFKTKDEEVIKLLNNMNDKEIKFTGYVDNTELKKIIAEAKILIQPSLYEGFGIPPLEALALNTVPIVSNIEVFKEIYKDLPVIFFDLKNTSDLKNKLLKNKKVTENYENALKKYSYKKCAYKILKGIYNG